MTTRTLLYAIGFAASCLSVTANAAPIPDALRRTTCATLNATPAQSKETLALSLYYFALGYTESKAVQAAPENAYDAPKVYGPLLARCEHNPNHALLDEALDLIRHERGNLP